MSIRFPFDLTNKSHTTLLPQRPGFKWNFHLFWVLASRMAFIWGTNVTSIRTCKQFMLRIVDTKGRKCMQNTKRIPSFHKIRITPGERLCGYKYVYAKYLHENIDLWTNTIKSLAVFRVFGQANRAYKYTLKVSTKFEQCL